MREVLCRLCALFLVLALTGCYATAVIPEDAEVSQPVTDLPILIPEDTNDELRALYFAALALQAQQDTAAQNVFSTPETAALDDFCASQPGQFSFFCQDLYTGEAYLYGEDRLYYPASLLKAPYALWLCLQADEGTLDLDAEIPNLYRYREWNTALEDYNEQETLPVREAIRAMIAQSDNNALSILASIRPGREEFQDWLRTLEFACPDTCTITREDGIKGVCSITDMAAVWQTLYLYFEGDAPSAAFLQDCFFEADHPGLPVPEGAPAARKYGSWEGAFHDAALIYAVRPYLLICMTDQGSEEVSFPDAPLQAMDQLGQMAARFLLE